MSEAAKAIKREFNRWIDEDDVSGGVFEIIKVEDYILHLRAEGKKNFTINFNSEYPTKKDKFVIASTNKSLGEWVTKSNEEGEKKSLFTLKSFLTKAAEIYVDKFGQEEEEPEPEDDLGLDDVQEVVKQTKEKKPVNTEVELIDAKKFLQIGSAMATLRLITDLKNIYKQDPKNLGFSAEPALDTSGLQNLYHWNVKLFNFEEKCPIGKDLAKLKKSQGIDHVQLEMRFSADYPHVPPFVRVIKPKFAFRTGHVTVGGSICMELLTTSGWAAVNDIESILIQIRSEIVEGGAQLDPAVFSGGIAEYSESEAWDAFYRAAKGHGWETKGLGPTMFPKVEPAKKK